MVPSISVIMPVYDGSCTIERALKSVAQQTFPDWEVVAVDDGSSDDSAAIVNRWASQDARIKLLHHAENRGVSAARNSALRVARGKFITYLDQDDEYYPDYLDRVHRLSKQADVAMFAYDFAYDDGPVGGRCASWDPAAARDQLFTFCISVPLGVAHRRSLIEKIGGFNEAWCEEDFDVWRRFARSGVEFSFVPDKSGRYHVHGKNASRSRPITKKQLAMLVANWTAGRPIYADSAGAQTGSASEVRSDKVLADASDRRGRSSKSGDTAAVRKIAFLSPHCLLDFTNGAATATLDALSLLARSGLECQAFCSTRSDAREEVDFEKRLDEWQLPYTVRESAAPDGAAGGSRSRIISTTYGQVPLTLFRSASGRGNWTGAEAAAFLAACDDFLASDRPDMVWTYGGDRVSLAVQRLVKRRDIPILFGLHNFSYRVAEPFRMVDYVVVPTEFCRQFYWNSLGLACLLLPLAVDPARVSGSRDLTDQEMPLPAGGEKST